MPTKTWLGKNWENVADEPGRTGLGILGRENKVWSRKHRASFLPATRPVFGHDHIHCLASQREKLLDMASYLIFVSYLRILSMVSRSGGATKNTRQIDKKIHLEHALHDTSTTGFERRTKSDNAKTYSPMSIPACLLASCLDRSRLIGQGECVRDIHLLEALLCSPGTELRI